jgi:hypothetical protein
LSFSKQKKKIGQLPLQTKRIVFSGEATIHQVCMTNLAKKLLEGATVVKPTVAKRAAVVFTRRLPEACVNSLCARQQVFLSVILINAHTHTKKKKKNVNAENETKIT